MAYFAVKSMPVSLCPAQMIFMSACGRGLKRQSFMVKFALEIGHASLPEGAQDLDMLGSVFVAVIETVITRHRPFANTRAAASL